MADTSSGATYEKTKKRRGFSSIQAIDPHDGGRWDVLVPDDWMDWIAKDGPGRARELAFVLPWILLHPHKIFRGIRDLERDLDEDEWLCYVAIPGKAFDYKTGAERCPWPNEVVLVCVTDERVVYNWLWVAADPENPRLPVDWRTRFREEVL